MIVLRWIQLKLAAEARLDRASRRLAKSWPFRTIGPCLTVAFRLMYSLSRETVADCYRDARFRGARMSQHLTMRPLPLPRIEEVRIHLVGVSFGGMIAQVTTLARPDFVRSFLNRTPSSLRLIPADQHKETHSAAR